MFLIVLIFVFTGVVPTFALAKDDLEGSKDHPMISRYEGSYIKAYEQVDYDRVGLPSGKEDGKLEGKITKILYEAPEGVSVLQIQRNYKMALKDAGFEILYEREKKSIGGNYTSDLTGTAAYSMEDGQYILVASNENEDGRARNRRVELVKMIEL